MKKLIIFVSAIFLILVVYSLPVSSEKVQTIPAITPSPTPQPFSEDKLWSLIQEWRKSQGLSPYIKDQRLCDIAEDRADDMALIDAQDNHKGFREKYNSYPYVISENTNYNPSERAMLRDWLKSQGHRETLEKPYIYSCIACEQHDNKGGSFCSQIFSNF